MNRFDCGPAESIVRQHAAAAAHKAGQSVDFFMTQMNYASLVVPLRAAMAEGSICLSCGCRFMNERDIQIEYREPPRHSQDWERLHVQNIFLLCASCGSTKRGKPFAEWLHERWLREQTMN
jgi:hypothetical protein